MQELMLDTANWADLEYGLAAWPIAGVTTNPTILKREGNGDLWNRLVKIKALCGKQRSLHVQVVSNLSDEMEGEARRILDKLGADTYIKIPVSVQGLPVIQKLAAKGVNVTATAVYTAMQGMLALLAGAKYAAVYVNRIENGGGDPMRVLRELRAFIDAGQCTGKILAASFKNAGQITGAYAAGAQSVTAPPELVKSALELPAIDAAVAGFQADFESLYGKGQDMLTLE